MAWIRDNAAMIAVIAAMVIILVMAIWALLLWLRSRAQFIFIDNLVRDEGAIVAPWGYLRRQGNSLFLFQLVLHMLMGLAGLAVLGLGALLAWPDIQARDFTGHGISAIVVVGVLVALMTLGLVVIQMVVMLLVVPVMYLRDQTFQEAWHDVRTQLLPGNTGTIVLFMLLYVAISIAASFVAAMATCLTCCMTALPYIGTVILLPILVFMQCYALYFVQQFGPQWRIFLDDSDWICPQCGYDLRGNPDAVTCPECGAPVPEMPEPRPPGDARGLGTPG
jgi:hypothetical protein